MNHATYNRIAFIINTITILYCEFKILSFMLGKNKKRLAIANLFKICFYKLLATVAGYKTIYDTTNRLYQMNMSITCIQLTKIDCFFLTEQKTFHLES